ncbi:hypothetical protein [Bacillus sp. BML-BC060]|uniref:hypothetical protein n=1 Tax=Bacillus sp. BML-BC060 TaxID=2842487 RepID=UPI001C81648E|nr:hypothetical protein [Bacillus sp. BML-BC060]
MTVVNYYSLEEVMEMISRHYIKNEKYKGFQMSGTIGVINYKLEAVFRVGGNQRKFFKTTQFLHEYFISFTKQEDTYKIASETSYTGVDNHLIETIEFTSKNLSYDLTGIIVENKTDVVLHKLQSSQEQGWVTKEEVQQVECFQRWIPLFYKDDGYKELLNCMEEDYKKGKVGEEEYKRFSSKIRTMRMENLFGKGE